MKQHNAVIQAMKESGGYATLGQLYQAVHKIKDCVWKTKTPFASIRRIVQERPEFFRIRPGLWALTSEKERIMQLFSDERFVDKDRDYTHLFYQGLIVEIGNYKGLRTFVPSQDKNKPFLQGILGDVSTIANYFEFTYDPVVRRGQTIDVTWFNDRGYPHSFFEVEHSTDISNSLLKFVEFQDFRVNFFIVADIQRRREYNSKLSSVAFTPIKLQVKFWDYDSVAGLHTKISASVLAERALL
jgi:hypothetical protein